MHYTHQLEPHLLGAGTFDIHILQILMNASNLVCALWMLSVRILMATTLAPATLDIVEMAYSAMVCTAMYFIPLWGLLHYIYLQILTNVPWAAMGALTPSV